VTREQSRWNSLPLSTTTAADAASHTNINNELQPANAKPDYAIKGLTESYTF